MFNVEFDLYRAISIVSVSTISGLQPLYQSLAYLLVIKYFLSFNEFEHYSVGISY
jgi:hypothetical protein